MVPSVITTGQEIEITFFGEWGGVLDTQAPIILPNPHSTAEFPELHLVFVCGFLHLCQLLDEASLMTVILGSGL